MPRDVTRQLTPETLGRGVYDPHEFKAYSNEGPMVVRMYAEDPDASLVVWNLEPGQETDSHRHPENLHVFIVLNGHGEYVNEGSPIPISPGQTVIIPRGVVHFIRNTGTEPLSYLAVSTYGPEGYVRERTR